MTEIAQRELQGVYLLICDLSFQSGHCHLATYRICVLIFLKALGLSFTCSIGAVTNMMQFSLNFIRFGKQHFVPLFSSFYYTFLDCCTVSGDKF